MPNPMTRRTTAVAGGRLIRRVRLPVRIRAERMVCGGTKRRSASRTITGAGNSKPAPLAGPLMADGLHKASLHCDRWTLHNPPIVSERPALCASSEPYRGRGRAGGRGSPTASRRITRFLKTKRGHCLFVREVMVERTSSDALPHPSPLPGERVHASAPALATRGGLCRYVGWLPTSRGRGVRRCLSRHRCSRRSAAAWASGLYSERISGDAIASADRAVCV